jgi:hypothetical protein
MIRGPAWYDTTVEEYKNVPGMGVSGEYNLVNFYNHGVGVCNRPEKPERLYCIGGNWHVNKYYGNWTLDPVLRCVTDRTPFVCDDKFPCLPEDNGGPF